MLMPAQSAADNASPIAELTLVSIETVPAPDERDRGDHAWTNRPMVKVTFTTAADLGALQQLSKRSVHVSVMKVRDNLSYTHDRGRGSTLYDEDGQVAASNPDTTTAGSTIHSYHFYIGLVPQGFGPITGNVRDSIMSPSVNMTEPSFTIVPRDFISDPKPMGFKFLGMRGNSNFVPFPREEFEAAVKAGLS